MNSERTITEKQGYEAMLHMLHAFYKASGSDDLTDVLSGGEYWPGTERPTDSAFADYWEEAVDKVLAGEPPLTKVFVKKGTTEESTDPDQDVIDDIDDMLGEVFEDDQ